LVIASVISWTVGQVLLVDKALGIIERFKTCTITNKMPDQQKPSGIFYLFYSDDKSIYDTRLTYKLLRNFQLSNCPAILS
jgi:hypothetical protein